MYEYIPLAGGTLTALAIARWLTKVGTVATMARIVSFLLVVGVVAHVAGVISVDTHIDQLLALVETVLEVARSI